MESTVKAAHKPSLFAKYLPSTVGTVGVHFVQACLMAFRDIVVVALAGLSAALDAFYLAYLFPAFLINLLSFGLHTAIVPQFKQGDLPGNSGLVRWVFIRSSMPLLALFGLLLLVWSSVSFDGTQATVMNCLLLVFPSILLANGSALMRSALNYNDRFIWPATTALFIPVASLFCFWILYDDIGTQGLALGITFGYAIEFLIIGFMYRRAGYRWRRQNVKPINTDRLLQTLSATSIASLIMYSTSLVDQYMASLLYPGAIASLNFGYKVGNFVIAIVASGVATVAYPKITQLIQSTQWAELRRYIVLAGGLVFLLGLVAALVFYVSAGGLIPLLFERGQFLVADSVVVIQLHQLYCLAIPFYLVSSLGVRYLYGVGRGRQVVYVGCINFVGNIIMNYVLMQFMGINGIVASTVGVYLISTTLVLGLIIHDQRGRSEPEAHMGSLSERAE